MNDVVVGEFQMPWEKKDAFWKWATDDSGMEQVGTVYTAQGFEFDYMAVIFGNDFVYEPTSGEWRPVPEASHDTQVKRNNPKLNEHLASVYRVLLSRAHKGVYVHFMDKGTEAYFKTQLARPTPFRQDSGELAAALPTAGEESATHQRAAQSLGVISLDDARAKRGAFKTHLPVYSLKAAAGYFGAGTAVEPEGWIEVSTLGRLDKDMFVARAVGRSMEPTIHDGDFCVFRANPPGSRQGKIVLVQYRGPADPETGGAFSVKRYRSEKSESSDGAWQHERIVLEPLNRDFQPILLTREAEGDVQVVAELVKVLR